jgi:ADP-ribosylglycohydrolase
VVMFFHPDSEAAVHHAGESSKTTHGAAECIEACQLFAAMLSRALDGAGKDEVLAATPSTLSEPRIVSIAQGGYRAKPIHAIHGTGYVVASLEAALWCFSSTDDFEAAILQAVNLGDDADTTAAICGQLAGAFYGAAGIPSRWLEKLTMRDEISRLATCLHAARPA